MNVQVVLFAQARESAGVGRRVLPLPEGSRVRDALDVLVREHPALAPLRAQLATAVDGELVPGDVPLSDGAELAVLPPVSGG